MKYGLIGERLGHSFSKIIHERLGEYSYELREVAKNELDLFMRKKNFLGINVTIPYKESVIPYLDEIDEAAREIGAVNTVVNRDGKLCGYNTDFYGMKMLFAHANIDAKDKKAVILGTGGTSKTALAVLSSLGASEILCVSRSEKNNVISYSELLKNHTDAEIIVNTTPVGMYPRIFEMAVDIGSFKRADVIDAIYNPLRPQSVLCASGGGRKAEGGLYMLVAQAVRASEMFLEKKYDTEIIDEIYGELLKEKQSIVLVGMPSSGKTTVGKLLSKRLGRRFIDTDDIITERIKMSIKDFFALHGEAAFRDIECQVIKELASEGSLVIATGGGAILRKENISALKYNGKIFFIDRPIQKLVPTDTRPLSSDRASVEQRYNERYPIYCSCCDVHIDGDGEADEVAERILENF